MAKADAYDDAFNAAATPAVTAENVATHGTIADIARITLALRATPKEQAKMAATVAATGDTAKFCEYARTVYTSDSMPDGAPARGDYLHTQIATPAISLLNKTPSAAIIKILDTVAQTDRQELLNRMLRMAANGGHTALVERLLSEGAQATTQNSRALLNAIHNDKIDTARVLYKASADIAQAISEARVCNYTADQMKALGSALCKLVDASCKPIDFYHVAFLNTAKSYDEKSPMRAAAMAQLRGGDPAYLQEFYRGYMEFKRDGERQRGGNDGYTTHVIKPLVELMMEAGDPAATLALALNRLPLRDRQTASGLVLRHLCASGASPLMIDAAIDAGADVRMFGNLALSLAVRGGHTDIALHLVRQCGANIGEAVLDAQINSVKAEEMAKLYSFMASVTTPQLITAPAFKIGKRTP